MSHRLCYLIIIFCMLPCSAMEQEGIGITKTESTTKPYMEFFTRAKKLDYMSIDEQFDKSVDKKLHKAVIDDNPKEIKEAILAGADPNTSYKTYPLYYAVQKYAQAAAKDDEKKEEEYFELIKFLTHHGANAHLGPLNKTPYELARHLKNNPTIKVFFDKELKKTQNIFESEIFAMAHEYTANRFAMDDKNIDKQFDKDIDKALHKAVVRGDIGNIKEAILKGANPNSMYKNYPLYYAVSEYAKALETNDQKKRAQYFKLIVFLVTAGANPYLGREQTPYELAAQIQNRTVKNFFDSRQNLDYVPPEIESEKD